MPAGRPTDYSLETAEAIIELMSQGYSVHEICSAPNMPDETTFYRWVRKHEGFRQKYHEGRDTQTDALMDRIVMASNMLIRGDGDASAFGVAIRGYETAAKRMTPRKYGDKLQTENKNEHSGTVGLSVNVASEDDKKILEKL